MTIHDGIQWLCAIGTVTLVLIGRDRLRINSPKVRVAVGVAGILLALLIFFSVMQLLPRPWESGFSAFTDNMTLVACSAFAGLLVLSLIEIVGSTLQAIKRRRYYRRNVG
ncbi:hypothetical protein J2W40_001223 [Sphingobium xenophagum]|uniref:Uncharacterized protein n=1 Tax=Sphingobium xenophagum TaxID=121428 RepID=A0ABU1WZR7_SPHXE|nr:hypothetical protein [Sphingobium xenophagum]